MMSQFGLRSRLILLGITSVSLPMALSGLLAWLGGTHSERRVLEETRAMVDDHFEHTVLGVAELAGLAKAQLEAQLEVQRNVAEEALRRLGGLILDPRQTDEWNVRNQFSQQTHTVSVPKARVGEGDWLQHDSSFTKASPLVDEISRTAGGVATLFLRMDPDGSLLRVATTVRSAVGERAIGTYIPSINPDGKPNPVVAALRGGEIFRGRAVVVDQWMLTVYVPLKDNRGEVIGALFAGLPEKDAFERIREAVLAMRPGGTTGRVEVFNASGANAGQHVIAGQSANEPPVLELGSANENLLRDILADAARLAPGATGVAQLPAGPAGGNTRYARFTNFPAWDWVIVASADEKAIFDAPQRLAADQRSLRLKTLFIAATSVIFAGLVWLWLGARITNRIRHEASKLLSGASELARAAKATSETSTRLADGASNQAASIEQTSATMEAITNRVVRNAQSGHSAKDLVEKLTAAAATGGSQMAALDAAMLDSQRAGQEVGGILKEIDGIAFQTNLLALNAAVEAARAGSAGAGFAVVAEEVRSLAARCALAAKETSRLVGTSTDKVTEGARLSRLAIESFEIIHAEVRELNQMIADIATASEEQSRGVAQVTEALGKVNLVTHSISASAEEAANAGVELTGQSQNVNQAATTLIRIVDGAKT